MTFGVRISSPHELHLAKQEGPIINVTSHGSCCACVSPMIHLKIAEGLQVPVSLREWKSRLAVTCGDLSR